MSVRSTTIHNSVGIATPIVPDPLEPMLTESEAYSSRVSRLEIDPAHLRIYALGPFSVRLPSNVKVEPKWSNTYSRTLLKCLLAAPEYCRSCEEVIELLWPEADPDRGREYLRDTVSRLRKTLEPQRRAYSISAYITKNREFVSLIVPAPTWDAYAHAWRDGAQVDAHGTAVWVDAERFETLATAALVALAHPPLPTPSGNITMNSPRTATNASTHAHANVYTSNEREGDSATDLAYRALALYRGNFLAADLYVDWARIARARYFRLWVALLRHLAEIAIIQRQYAQAVLLLGQLVDALPDDEDAAGRLMLVQGATGHRGEARRTYEQVCAHLQTTLGMPPARELQLLAQTIFSSESHQALLTLLL